MKQVMRLILLVLLIALLTIGRPLLHPFVMTLVIHPIILIFLALLVGLIWWLKPQLRKLKMEKQGNGNFTVVPQQGFSWKKLLLGYFIFQVSVGVLVVENEFRYQITGANLKFETIENLPTFTPIRLTPKQVATRYAEDSFQSSQEYLGDSQIVLVDGQLKRVFPRLPEGAILYFLNKLSGFVTVDVGTLARKVDIQDQHFALAEGIGIFDNLHYQLIMKKYFVTYSHEPIYLKSDSGEWVTVVPYIKYEGLLFRTPEWGGVMVINSKGEIRDYTPEEAPTVSYLQNNRIYPKELAEFQAESYAYRGGLINKWFVHKDQTEVVHLANGEMVLHVPTDRGYKQMLVAEPYGRSYGIYKIFFIDATTGKFEIKEYDSHSQLTGPVAAADYIKRDFPTYDWSSFGLAEPRPLYVNNDLYWMLSIIPNDAAGIASTVVLNSRTNEVVNLKTEEEVKEFVKGELTTPAPTEPSSKDVKAKIEEIQRQLDELKELVK